LELNMEAAAPPCRPKALFFLLELSTRHGRDSKRLHVERNWILIMASANGLVIR
jgi:hypothetical protein